MSGWHDFERMRGELEQARDTRLDVDDPADAALAHLYLARAILDGGLSAGEQLDELRRHDGYEPRHSAPGRARRWRR